MISVRPSGGHVLLLALLFAPGCTKTGTAPKKKGPAAAPAAAIKPLPPPIGGEASPRPAAAAGCGALNKKYLATRLALNTCKHFNDCAAMWPGLCPHGPYYIHRESDVGELDAVTKKILGGCSVPECAKPRALPPARCEKGRCVAGRKPPTSSPSESCWDYQETYMVTGRAISATSVKHVQGITPLVVAGVRSAGKMTIRVDWFNCPDCELLVSEHNSGMANLKKGTRVRKGGKETVALTVTPGLYYFVGVSAGVRRMFHLEIDLTDDKGAPAGVTHHGVSWQRMCEG